ncbi:MAG TPA: VOC family protein [Nitrospiraceae bacterium]|jgi:catechol 2,3-dioxygenase-like lactoylglutathione lyase family enzyme|nr:VOC family protein [Nitrospiraceae bacterium]
MAIILNHTIMPAHDKEASARFFAEIFGLKYEGSAGHFAPVRVNETLTLDFDDADHFEIHHYAFHGTDPEFDAMLKRVQEAGIPYSSDPWNLENKELNSWNGGRGVYFRDPNGHILELMTRVPRAG